MKHITRLFAAYVMRGRIHAMLVTAACAVLSLAIFPLVFPLSQLSAACVALVTLRLGARDGALIIVGATLVTALLAMLSASRMYVAVDFILTYIALIWAPVWLVSAVLRYTRALDLALTCAGALGILVVVVMHVSVGDVTAWWTGVLSKALAPALQRSPLSAEQGRQLIQDMAGHMTGSLAAGFVIGIMVSVFIARWWQAMLYYPGGFRKEFHGLRLGRGIAVFSAGVALLSLLPLEKLTEVSHDVFIVIIAAYMLHGLSVIHTVVAAYQWRAAWLGVIYLMVVLLPPVRVLVAAAGYADSWIDLRSRIRVRLGRSDDDVPRE